MYQHPHGYLSQGLEKHQTKYFNEQFHLAQVIAKNKCEHFRGTPCITVSKVLFMNVRNKDRSSHDVALSFLSFLIRCERALRDTNRKENLSGHCARPRWNSSTSTSSRHEQKRKPIWPLCPSQMEFFYFYFFATRTEKNANASSGAVP